MFTNQLIREALHPYPDELVIVTKVGAARGPEGTVFPAMAREQLTQAVHDNLRNLGVDVLEVVNLRSMLRDDAPAQGALEQPLGVIADLQRQGLIRHIGLSNVTAARSLRAGAPAILFACRISTIWRTAAMRSWWNSSRRINSLTSRISPWEGCLSSNRARYPVLRRLDATPTQVALAWLLQHAPNILSIPGTSSLVHLRENFAAATLAIPAGVIKELDAVSETIGIADSKDRN
jgi:aryl-alcohol dehydrogenase-like predicted oxidoreductase